MGSITGNKDWARNPPFGGTTYKVSGSLSLNTQLGGISGTYENGDAMYGLSFNANVSNAIFGAATTVQTSSYQVLMIIKI